MMLTIGLTGNIGSGKTIVSQIFQILGIPVFHADDEAKKLYLYKDVKEKLLEITGPEIFDEAGEVDRKKMAAVIFRDKAKLNSVNRLIHPLVRKALYTFSEIHSQSSYILYEAAILVESGYYKQLNKLVLISAPEHVRLDRVSKRDGVPREAVALRASHQMPEEEKIRLADFIIYNDGSRLVIPQVLEVDRLLRSAT